MPITFITPNSGVDISVYLGCSQRDEEIFVVLSQKTLQFNVPLQLFLVSQDSTIFGINEANNEVFEATATEAFHLTKQ